MEITISMDHIEELVQSKMYHEALAYVVKKFYETAEIGLTESGALAISEYLFKVHKVSNSEQEDKEILWQYVAFAYNDEEGFFTSIKLALLKVGMELMKDKEA